MSTQLSLKEIIDSKSPEEAQEIFNDKQSWIIISEDQEILKYPLKKKKIKHLKIISDKLKGDKKDKIINKIGKNSSSILFLALDAGKDYFEVFKNYENIDWSVLGKNGNNLLHHALSLEDVSEESLNFLYEKLGGYECLFKINDDSENALHCAANLKNFKWCLDKCKSSDPSQVKSLLHSINKVGETPVVKLLKKKNLLNDKALLKEITDVLRENEYDFLKTDNNEQNAISLAVKSNYSVLLTSFLDRNPFYEKERSEIIFSAIEHGKDDLLKSLEIEDKGDFIVRNYAELAQRHPKRLANLIVNNQSILSDCIKLYETRNGHFTSDKLFSVLRRMMYLAVDHTNDKLADQCLAEYRLLKNYVSFYEKDLVIPGLLERQNSTGETILDYAARNNPEMFVKLVQRSPGFELDTLLSRYNTNQESRQINQKEKITPSITGLFTSVNNHGWYDTGGILASLADLVIKENNDSPKIFVQPGTDGQQRSLSDELKEVSKRGQDVIYIRRNPINEKGGSSPHWTVLYFSQGKNGKCNLLVVDPYGANEPSAVVKEAAEGIVGNNIYVSTTKIQHDGNSCGLISSEVARAIYSQKGKLQKLLEGNNQKIDIEQILPKDLIKDAKENGKVDYGRRFENFNCLKVRNAHVQTAQAIGEAILDKIDTIPSQVLISKILTGKENSLAEQTATLGHDSIDNILNLCSKNDHKSKREIVSILTGKNITDKTVDQEIALLLSQDEAKVNQQQVEKLEQALGEENFRPIRERLDAQIQQPQLPQLNNEQEEKIRQIRRSFESELKNTAPQKKKSNDSLLYKFLCSASVNDIKQFFDSNNFDSNNKVGDKNLSKAAFAAARNCDISRLKVFIDRTNNIIYETDVSGQSLLEVAAENFHPEVVQYIIRKHNEVYKSQNDKTADGVPYEFLGFVDNIGNRKDPWAKDLAKELKRILNKKDFNESDGSKIERIFFPYIKNEKTKKKAENINDYGNLQHYSDVLKSGNIEKFKTALEKIDPKHELYSLLNGDGHNLITLTAALGTSDHWKEIEKAYNKVEGRAAISASLDNSSSIGSPIQAAIIASNLPMFNHFIDSKNGFIINKRYGAEQNNILHTTLQSDKAELLNDIIFKFKDNKKPFIKALQQANQDNKSPLDLVLEEGHYGFFERALDAIVSYDKENIKDLLIANDCGLIKSAVSFGNERIVERVLNLQNEYNKSVKDKKDHLNLLNYNNRYDKGNRLEKSGLLNLACKHNNTQVANYVLKLLRDKEKMSSKIFVNALTASISKDSSNKEIFDFLFSQDIDFNAFIKAQYSPVYKAADYGNISALKYFINKFPANDILNLQDENGETPLHLAISNGDRKTVEFLIENGVDFDKLDNRDVTPFELALENNKFADICIDLLKHNPKATMPLYRAISSGNKSLIGNLIDRNDWVLDQRNEETALKFALRSGVDKGLTAKIANKSIENFKRLDEKSQEVLLKLGFLNDVVKSGADDQYIVPLTTMDPLEEQREKGKVSEFIESEIKKDSSLLSIASQGTTLLHDIVSSNDFDLFEAIENHIEPEVITKKFGELEETALHSAVRSGNASIVKTIVEKVGDQENIKLAVNEYSAGGYTPFQTAAQLGNWEIYNLLNEKRGDLKYKTKNGDSIAHLLILSAMKDPTDGSYEYQELLKDYPELVKSTNNRGDGLIATAARCTNQDEASEIMEQLLENEFKHKKSQLTEEDAIKLLSNAIASNNFSAVRKVVLDNIKVPFASKVASAIAGDDTDKTPQAKVRRTIAHTIALKKNIHGINEVRVLSQSTQKVLLSTEEQKQSLSQNILNFLHIKTQKGSSNKVDTDTLLNFLMKDQNSYAKFRDNFPLVEEEVKVSHTRKDIFVQQKELSQRLDNFLKQKLKYPSWKKQKERNEDEITQLQNTEYTLEVCESIVRAIDTSNSIDDVIKVACNHYFQNNPNQNPNEIIHNGVTRRQCVIDDIKSVIKNNGYIDFTLYYQNFKGAQSEEDRAKEKKACLEEIDSKHNSLKSKLNDCHQQITELNKKIGNYRLDTYNLSKIKVPQDVLYTNCRDLGGRSIADRIFTSNELPLIKEVILENENLWDPRFVDSEGNTLLHKLAQMIEKDCIFTKYIKPLINKGFSLTRKNNDGKSARDIFEDVFSKDGNKEVIDYLAKRAKFEEQTQKYFEEELNSLLNIGPTYNTSDLVRIVRGNKEYKQYYSTIFNPLHSIVSSCFNDDLSNDYLFNKKLNCFKKFLKNNDLRPVLDSTDEERCNFLHRAIEEATNNYSGSSTNKMLKEILLDVARGLNSSRNFKLCNELFFKQRNSKGDNVIEALSKVQNSLDIFKELEKEFSRNAFADECDLNLVLVNAAGSKNSSLFEHVIESYRLNRFRTPSEEGQPPLHVAVISGNQKTVLAVLKSGANINQINSSGRTALHELLIFLHDNPSSQKHIDLVYYLESRGAFFGHYQEEEGNKGGEISEVIESIDEDIQKKVLFNIARGRAGFYNLKYSLLSEAENFIKSKNISDPLVVDLDISGSTAFVQINNGKFKSSKFLNSDICKSNHLTTSYFDVDGCKGYVQKSVSGQRNYVIFEDAIDGDKKNHPTKIKVWLSKEQSITVLVSADGAIEPAKTSYKVMGVEIKDDLSEYRERKQNGEFEKNHEKYKDYIEKLWGKVDSQNEYKDDVYIGGIPLKEALMQGRWCDRGLQRQTQENKILDGTQKSPEDHDMPSYSKRNSKDDGIGETIEDAQIDQQDHDQMGRDSNHGSASIVAADSVNDIPHDKSATEILDNEQKESTRLGEKNQINNQSIGRFSMNNINDKFSKNLSELEQRLAQPNKGLKSTQPQERRSDSDELVNELQQRFAQPNKGLKSTQPQERRSDSDELVSELEQRSTLPKMGLKEVDRSKINPESLKRLVSDGLLSGEDEKRKNFYEGINQAAKEIAEGFKDIADKSAQSLSKKTGLISNSQEIENAQSQQVKMLTNEKEKSFYESVKEVIKEIAEGLKDIVEESKQALNKKTKLNLDIDHDNNINSSNLNTPDSGYGSIANSPNEEEKGIRDSYESEKSKANITHNKSSGEKYTIEDSGIELDDIELEIEDQKGMLSIKKVFDQEKGMKDSHESEKQTGVNNYSSDKSKAKLIKVKEYEPELSKIQIIRKNLTPPQNTKNHMGPKAKEKFEKLDTNYKNGKSLRIGNKQSLPPILSSGNNKQGRGR